jgi:hypothetical protein
VKPHAEGIRIFIQGLGPVPSFKNKKRIVLNKATGKPFLATESKTKRWMKQAVESIASQLRSTCQIREGGTTPECLKRFAMQSLPLDDNWQELEIGHVHTKLCPPGKEGAIVTLQPVEPARTTEDC